MIDKLAVSILRDMRATYRERTDQSRALDVAIRALINRDDKAELDRRALKILRRGDFYD